MANDPNFVLDEFIAAVKAGDYDALADLYEEDAILAVADMGVVVRGREAIKATFQGFQSMGEYLGTEIRSRPVTVCGDFAVASIVCTISLKSPDGETVEREVESKEAMHKGADGNWRYIADLS